MELAPPPDIINKEEEYKVGTPFNGLCESKYESNDWRFISSYDV